MKIRKATSEFNKWFGAKLGHKFSLFDTTVGPHREKIVYEVLTDKGDHFGDLTVPNKKGDFTFKPRWDNSVTPSANMEILARHFFNYDWKGWDSFNEYIA